MNLNLNLKGTERMDYIFNIQSFGQLYDIAKERKGAEFEAKFGRGRQEEHSLPPERI